MRHIIDNQDKRFPKLLRQIGKEMPGKLYYKGNWDLVSQDCLAVVGSRRLTSYGRKMTEQLVEELASAGLVIVSGFMYGGDEVAHSAAVRAGGKTIAVMPCGIDIIHPAYQKELYNKILDNNGLIMSEFEGKIPPAVWTYPRRNRIVAGLSKAVLVVEAGLRSGTLITAGFAKKFKRQIFALPGPVNSEASQGANQLIKEGASIVTSAKDILNFYNIDAKKIIASSSCHKKKQAPKNPIEKRIFEQLKKEPMDIDSLALALKIPIAKLGTVLSMMQVKGLIVEENKKFYNELTD